MIDYAIIAPMMSLSTFIVVFITVLFIGRAFVELVDIYGKKKSPSSRGNGRTSSKKLAHRYNNIFRKGA